MKKSYMTTLIFAGLFAALVAWYVVYEEKMRPQAEEAEQNEKRFVTFERENIQEFAVTRVIEIKDDAKQPPENPRYETIRFKKVGDTWSIVEPVQDKADSGAVNGMLNTISSSRFDRIVEESPTDLTIFGLVNPLVKVTAKKDSSAPEQEFWVGSDTPVDASNYVLIKGDPKVYKGARTLRTSFLQPLKELRSKKIIELTRDDVDEVEILTKSSTLVLQEQANSDWQLVREGIPADMTEWNKTLTAIVSLTAEDFAAEQTDNLTKFGLDPAAVTVNLRLKKDKKTLTVLFGEKGGAVYAKRSDTPIVYQLSKDVLDKLRRPAKDYQNLALAKFNRFVVKQIVIEKGTETLDMSKEGTEWKLSGSEEVLDNSRVDTLLTNLQDIRITNFVKGAKPVAKPALKISLFRKGEEKSAAESKVLELAFEAPKGGSALGSREGMNLPFEISASDLAKLQVQKAELIKKESKAEKAAPPSDEKKSG